MLARPKQVRFLSAVRGVAVTRPLNRLFHRIFLPNARPESGRVGARHVSCCGHFVCESKSPDRRGRRLCRFCTAGQELVGAARLAGHRSISRRSWFVDRAGDLIRAVRAADAGRNGSEPRARFRTGEMLISFRHWSKGKCRNSFDRSAASGPLRSKARGYCF